MPNGTYGGVRGRKTKVGRKLLRFPPTRLRHALDDMEARQQCMDIMRELFRQFMSVLIQEKTRVEEEHIYLDPRISFQEIDRYFLSGCACAFFQVATDVYTDLRYNQEEWE